MILLSYREDRYDQNKTRKGIADIITAKQRNGPTGDVRLTFLGQWTDVGMPLFHIELAGSIPPIPANGRAAVNELLEAPDMGRF